MDDSQISGLPELIAHLNQLVDDPESPADVKLFDDVELQLNETNIPPLLPVLLPKLTTILKTSQSDPKTTVSLTIKLLSQVSFTQALTLADEESIIVALTSPAPSANILAMTILHKASSADDMGVLAQMPNVLAQFIKTWLCAPEVEVGEKGSRVFGDLLEADCELPPMQSVRHAITVDGVAWTNGSTNGDSLARHHQPRGQGVLWRRVFEDPNLYNLLLTLPAGESPDGSVEMTEHQKSLTQGRMLRILPRLATMNFGKTAKPLGSAGQGGDTAMGGTTEGATDQSLLHYVAVDMVDKTDVLMNLSLIDFFETLFSLMRIRVDEGGSGRGFIVDTLRGLVTEAGGEDGQLRAALLGLPDRTVPEEAEGLRAFVMEVLT